MKTILSFHRLIILLALTVTTLLPAAEKGTLGLGLAVKLGSDGSTLNPIIVLAIVKSVAPNSPADGSKIVVGDSLIEIDGLAVAGCKYSILKSKFAAEPGKTVKLKFKRANGDIYNVELTTVPKPR